MAALKLQSSLPSPWTVSFGAASIPPQIFTSCTQIFHRKRETFTYEVSKLSVSAKPPKWWQLGGEVVGACDTLGTFRVYFHPLDTYSVVLSLQQPVQGKRTCCPIFLEHVSPLCLAVGELLSLAGIAKLLQKQESWLCSPRETGRQRHPILSAPLQQCPVRAWDTRSMRRRERKRPILTLPAPGWQTSLLAAKPLGAASD